jgi:hypothetical protein
LSAQLSDAAGWIDASAVELSGGAKADRVLALGELIDQLRLEQVRSLGAFAVDGTWAADGARTAAGWVGARASVSRGRAAHLIGRASDLRSAESVEVAWRTGRVGEEIAFALLRARGVHPPLFDEQIADLLGWLDGLRVDHALVAIRHWMQIAENTEEAERAEGSGDPDDGAPSDPAAENRVGLHQSFQGRWSLDGDYDAVTGAEINERVKAWIDRQFQQGTYRSDDGMTYPQRVAAAIDALTERGALEGQTRQQGPRPSVSLHLDGKTLSGEPCEDVADAMSRQSNLADGTPVSRATAERLLCNGRLTATIERIGPFGTVEIEGITDLLRDATAHQRKALAVRDGGCVFPGCSAPPDWCAAHHLLPWDDGGFTLLQNLVLLCKHHHHLVHEGGWTLWRATDGLLYLNQPDGTPVPVTPHGQQTLADAPVPVAPSPPPRRPGELRFLTARERAARIAERERRQREASDDAPPPEQPRPIGLAPEPGPDPHPGRSPDDGPDPGDRGSPSSGEQPADAAPPPTRGRGVFGPHVPDERRLPPRHGPPAA